MSAYWGRRGKGARERKGELVWQGRWAHVIPELKPWLWNINWCSFTSYQADFKRVPPLNQPHTVPWCHITPVSTSMREAGCWVKNFEPHPLFWFSDPLFCVGTVWNPSRRIMSQQTISSPLFPFLISLSISHQTRRTLQHETDEGTDGCR